MSKHSYVCPSCSKRLQPEDELLYNISPVLLEGETFMPPIYVTLTLLNRWDGLCTFEQISDVLKNHHNTTIWSNEKQLSNSLKTLQTRFEKEKYQNHQFSIEPHKRLTQYKYSLAHKNQKIAVDVRSNNNGSITTYSGVHCPNCHASIIPQAFCYPQKVIGFVGKPEVGKTSVFAALAYYLNEILSAQILSLYRENDLFDTNTLDKYKSSHTPSRSWINEFWKATATDEQKNKHREASRDELILALYIAGIPFDKTDTEGNGIGSFDMSFLYKDTILTFGDISGEAFRRDLNTEIINTYPLLTESDVFIFCVEPIKDDNQRQNQLTVLIEQLADNSLLNDKYVTLLGTKSDRWLSTVQPVSSTNKIFYIQDLFGFENELAILRSPIFGLESTLDKMRMHVHMTPLHCSAYGWNPTEKVDSERKVQPYNIDLLTSWLLFVLSIETYGSGRKKLKNNPALPDMSDVKLATDEPLLKAFMMGEFFLSGDTYNHDSFEKLLTTTDQKVVDDIRAKYKARREKITTKHAKIITEIDDKLTEDIDRNNAEVDTWLKGLNLTRREQKEAQKEAEAKKVNFRAEAVKKAAEERKDMDQRKSNRFAELEKEEAEAIENCPRLSSTATE